MNELQTIVKLETVGPGRSRVYFKNGDVRDVDWKLFADDGPIFAPLKDPDFATSCKIILWGDGLEWPNGGDWSADAVHQFGVPVAEAETEKRPATKRRSA